ncbi:hypothetical protein VP01_2097g2 [Puccinia sorghi]|uniref:Uncharacterized protein n=1 Tax=Puccinia sorghi TaxID=27349 RepID=A0A0L6VAF5_9BASI|nr:hypothetical protein VP01_2097g2 [Puccinia sorghi]
MGDRGEAEIYRFLEEVEERLVNLGAISPQMTHSKVFESFPCHKWECHFVAVIYHDFNVQAVVKLDRQYAWCSKSSDGLCFFLFFFFLFFFFYFFIDLGFVTKNSGKISDQAIRIIMSNPKATKICYMEKTDKDGPHLIYYHFLHHQIGSGVLEINCLLAAIQIAPTTPKREAMCSDCHAVTTCMWVKKFQFCQADKIAEINPQSKTFSVDQLLWCSICITIPKAHDRGIEEVFHDRARIYTHGRTTIKWIGKYVSTKNGTQGGSRLGDFVSQTGIEQRMYQDWEAVCLNQGWNIERKAGSGKRARDPEDWMSKILVEFSGSNEVTSNTCIVLTFRT